MLTGLRKRQLESWLELNLNGAKDDMHGGRTHGDPIGGRIRVLRKPHTPSTLLHPRRPRGHLVPRQQGSDEGAGAAGVSRGGAAGGTRRRESAGLVARGLGVARLATSSSGRAEALVKAVGVAITAQGLHACRWARDRSSGGHNLITAVRGRVAERPRSLVGESSPIRLRGRAVATHCWHQAVRAASCPIANRSTLPTRETAAS